MKHLRINYWLINLLLFLLLWQIPSPGFSQDEEVAEEEILDETPAVNEVITLSDLLNLLSSSDGDLIVTNKNIVVGNNDASLMEDNIFYQEYHLDGTDDQEHKLFFYDCSFDPGVDKPLVFNGWRFKKLNFVGCTFNMPLKFLNCSLTGHFPLLMENCTCNNDLTFEAEEETPPDIILKQNTFHKQLIFNTNLASLSIDHCVFEADTNLFKRMDEERTHYQLLASFMNIGQLQMDHCRFISHQLDNLFSVDLSNSSIGKLSMFANQMEVLNFTEAGVEKALLIDSLEIAKYIGIQNFDFPEANTNIPWDNLNGQKLALFQKGLSDLVVPYQAKTEDQLSQTLFYNDLVSMYKKFNKLYLDRGDIQSANGSYIEIKQLETLHQEYIQTVDPSTNNYINLLLNKVLYYFSDYATNPGKSVKRAWQLLLFFTFIYMFTFSEWDGMNYSFYLNQFRMFAKYVESDKSIKEIYEKKADPNADLMKEIKENYLRDRKKVPRAIVLFGEPLHFLGRLRLVLVPQLIRFFNFQPKKWENLDAGERVVSGFLISLIVITFALYVLIVKFINGFILSLNSFVLIGFGVMPEKGVAMYITILEGIIGWFLLTIFTITLFSQVLQGGA
ncbi:MAG: hypothetical protein A2W85_07570 [Bacteroidetes bacterium GWF2_41_31]|nr:MAG: hypothetical protein A2W85_07570 [Bacteroidetes bacterium GWF2_41_31]OFZ08453.1 MAG: hypothetical protein A2338_03585 [Bacteroidetes bacterium RIFOXYB12_FULL_41_6]